MTDDALLRAIAADATVGSARSEALHRVVERAGRRRRRDQTIVVITAIAIITLLVPVVLSLGINSATGAAPTGGSIFTADLRVLAIWLLGHFAYGSGILLVCAAVLLCLPSFVAGRPTWFVRGLPRGLARRGALFGAVCGVLIAGFVCLPLADAAFAMAS